MHDNKIYFQNKGKCRFNVADLGACGEAPYGYMPEDETMSPCLFIKLNKIYALSPKAVDAEKLDDPEYDEMTPELKVANDIGFTDRGSISIS